MLLNASNLMILDEPTNHLDLDSKEVLLEALGDYGGTLIFVSHDRYFVDNLATKVVDVGGGKALLYPGGYEDFLYWKKQREAGVAAPLPSMRQAPTPSVGEPVRPGKSPAPAPKPAAKAPEPPRAKGAPAPAYDPLKPRLRPANPAADQKAREKDARKAKMRLTDLERVIGEKEHRVKELETMMASPGFYDDRAKADAAVADRQKLLDEVNALMGEWESLQAVAEVKG
jgi:ATP-binding cassette subfamily F protein 3